MALAGIAVALLALTLWVASPALAWLDGLVALLLAGALGLSTAAYLRGDAPHKRLAVVGLAVGAAGLIGLALLYAAG